MVPGDDRSHRDRMLAGQPYLGADPELAAGSPPGEASHGPVQPHRTSTPWPNGSGSSVSSWAGSGPDSEVRPPFYCDYGSQIRIGERTFVNFGLVALDPAPITIGSDVQIGPNVQLLTPTHPIDPDLRREKWEGARPIDIADNVWLGGGVIVLPGVSIGENTVVGAGAVVTRDVPAGVVVVGNPARVIREVSGG